MGLFKSVLGLVEDVATVVVAPIEIAVDMTRVITKPVADVAKEITEDIKQEVKDVTK